MYRELRVNRPEEYEALESTIERVKLAQDQEFHEQSEEVQQVLVTSGSPTYYSQ
jgi:hypothetical protein